MSPASSLKAYRNASALAATQGSASHSECAADGHDLGRILFPHSVSNEPWLFNFTTRRRYA